MRFSISESTKSQSIYPGWSSRLMTRPKRSNDVRFRLFQSNGVRLRLIESNDVRFRLRSILPDIVQLFSTLPDFFRLYRTMFDFLRFCSTLLDFTVHCLTLQEIFRFYRELALLVRRQGLLSNWKYHMVFIVVLDKFKCWWGPASRSRTYGATIATQNVYLAIIATQIANLMRLCAIQRRYVATFRDPNKVCCDHCDSKLVCWVIVRPKYLCDFERPKTDI